MNRLNVFLIIILLLIVLCTVFNYWNAYVTDNTSVQLEGYENMEKVDGAQKKWARSSSCAAYMNSTTYDCLKDNLIEQTDKPEEADIIFPCGYNNIENEIQTLPHLGRNNENNSANKKPQITFIMEGVDEFTAKDRMWKHLLKYHGREKAITICPQTYILVGSDRAEDIERLRADHVDGRLYIMKKNLQRQEGLHITSSIDEIIENKGVYNLAQELLTDSYLINGRKINLRVYVVVVCNRNRRQVLVFDDGFMYYTKNLFNPNDGARDSHITTGYIDREVYVRSPLTLKEFQRYLDLPVNLKYHPKSESRKLNIAEQKIRKNGQKISTVVFDRIDTLIRDTFEAFTDCTCRPILKKDINNPIYTDYNVEIFGADIAIDQDLRPKLMEINKGPDLNPKDERDSKVKKALVNTVFKLVGLTDENVSKTDNYGDLRLVLKN